MCFYFIIIFFGKKNKCVGGKPASTYDYFSFWGRSLLKNPNLWATKKWETIVSHQPLIPLYNTWLCSLKVSHSFSLLTTHPWTNPQLPHASPHTRYRTRATLFGRQHTPLLSTECKNNQINWMTRWGKICARNWRTTL